MPAPLLRRAVGADAEALAALGLQTFRDTFLHGFAIPYPPDDLALFERDSYSAEAFARKLADPRQATWVAEDQGQDEGRLLAYANAGPCTLPHPDVQPGDVELHRLYVRAAAQGLGVGRDLFALAVAWMEAAAPGRPLWLGVWSGNLKAQRFYAAHGFAKAGEHDFPVGRWRDHDFIYRRG